MAITCIDQSAGDQMGIDNFVIASNKEFTSVLMLVRYKYLKGVDGPNKHYFGITYLGGFTKTPHKIEGPQKALADAVTNAIASLDVPMTMSSAMRMHEFTLEAGHNNKSEILYLLSDVAERF